MTRAVLALVLATTASAQAPTLPTAEERAKLPEDGGPAWNRLVFEASPYLRMHAANPVDWYPWGDAAFERAKREKKPVFLSIGYATCHWCHVMAHESFEDARVAAFLNEHFVCVKVDREERPDVDDVYMRWCVMLTGSGGWPLSVFLTPDRKPFLAGTYFPPEDAGDRPGFLALLRQLSKAWDDGPDDVAAHAERLLELVRDAAKDAARSTGELDAPAAMERARKTLGDAFDAKNGGFAPPQSSGTPKFPMTHNLRFLLAWSERKGDGNATFLAEQTLDAMACGGIHDHVGGGFHRYSTDREWLVPHFEKMLYDQALLALAYAEAYAKTKRAAWRDVAEDVYAYALRDLRTADGAFASAEDADSGGSEGAFYLWGAEGVRDATKELVARPGSRSSAIDVDWSAVFGATREGNFVAFGATEPRGLNVLHARRPYWDPETHSSATALGVEPKATSFAAENAEAIERLFEARASRTRPLRDEKVLTDWNGLMIASLARGGALLGDPSLVDAARKAADFALAKLRRPDGRLWKRFADGSAGVDGVLSDSAYLAWGLVELHRADQDPRWLAEALQVAEMMLGQFRGDGADAAGGLYATARTSETLLLRTRDGADGALPNANAVAARTLLRLARITGSAELDLRAREILAAFAKDVASRPSSHVEMLLAHDLAVGPMLEVAIVGPREDPATRALLAAAQRAYAPNAVVLLVPSDETAPAIAKLAPWTKELTLRDGKPVAYVCSGSTCEAPRTDAEELAKRLARPYAPVTPGAAAK